MIQCPKLNVSQASPYTITDNLMNLKQKSVKAQKVSEQKMALREELWGKVDESHLWNRKKSNGFTTIPRTFPLIAKILDNLAAKGSPLSNTYMSIWCRVFDESFIEIENPSVLASESGFSGQRAVTTWNSRMAKLQEFGFINAQKGSISDYQYVLVYNPYKVIKKLNDDGRIQRELYLALFKRAQEIGAEDLKK